MRDLEEHCGGIGHVCARCGIVLPEGDDAPRRCPSINDDVTREETKERSPHDYDE